MAKIVQLHRMAASQASLYTGPAGEAIVDTGAYRMRIQDGVTPGGYSTLMGNLNLADLADAATARSNLGVAAASGGVYTGGTFTGSAFVSAILGTPASGNLTNCTGYDMVDLVGLAAGVATFLGAPSSANLFAALTTKTGTGIAVFSDSPVFTGSPQAPNFTASASGFGAGSTSLQQGQTLAGAAAQNYIGSAAAGYQKYLNIVTFNGVDGFAVFFVDGSGAIHIIASSDSNGGDSHFDTQNNQSSNGGQGISAFVTGGLFFIQTKVSYAGGAIHLHRLGG